MPRDVPNTGCYLSPLTNAVIGFQLVSLYFADAATKSGNNEAANAIVLLSLIIPASWLLMHAVNFCCDIAAEKHREIQLSFRR